MRNAKPRTSLHGRCDRSGKVRGRGIGAGALGRSFGRADISRSRLFGKRTLARDGDLLANGGEPRSLVLLTGDARFGIVFFTADPEFPVQKTSKSQFSFADLSDVQARDLSPSPVRVDSVVEELVRDDQSREESSSRTKQRRRGRETLEVRFRGIRADRTSRRRCFFGSNRENLANSLWIVRKVVA